ncbi:hypothetical protein O6H91_10G107000 [Diphasiastrum complanatum]|nr:hypothetical protein O6H91_10G107000 [Diphasiastrum complanatum]
MGLPANCQRTSIRNDSAESTADMAADPSATLNFFGRHGGEIECTFPFSEIEQAWPNTDNTVASESEKAWPNTDNTVASESEKAWPNAHNTLASVSENAWPNTYHTVASESEKAWPNAHNTLVSESENSWSNAFNTGQMQYEVLNRVEPSERTFTTDVLAYGRNISVTITSEAAVAQQWLGSRDGKMYGMDLEWKPNRYTHEDNKVALLQLCSDKECLMLQMLFLDLMPQGLVNFLLDAERKIAGVGIKEDTKKLRRDYGLQSSGVVELTVLAVQKIGKPKCKKMGLKSLLKEVTGLVIEKPKRITMSNWAQPSLDRHQIKYACIDAWASYAIYEKLMTYNWAVSRQAN